MLRRGLTSRSLLLAMRDPVADDADRATGPKPEAVESPEGSTGGGEKKCPSVPSSSSGDGAGDGNSSGGGVGDSSRSSSSSESVGAGGGGIGELPRLEARRLQIQMRTPVEMSLARTRGETRRMAEQDEDGGSDSDPGEEAIMTEVMLTDSAHLFLPEERLVESEMGFSGCTFEEIWEMFGCSESRMWDELPKSADDFNANLLSFMSAINSNDSNIEGDALAAEGLDEMPELRMPSGPVCDAEVPPVSVAGVQKSRFSWSLVRCDGCGNAGSGRYQNIHGGGQVA